MQQRPPVGQARASSQVRPSCLERNGQCHHPARRATAGFGTLIGIDRHPQHRVEIAQRLDLGRQVARVLQNAIRGTKLLGHESVVIEFEWPACTGQVIELALATCLIDAPFDQFVEGGKHAVKVADSLLPLGPTLPPPMRSPVPDSAREHCVALDAADPLAGLRERFLLPPGTIYVDGNSLGPPARDTAERLHEAVTRQWGNDLVRSWNGAGWIDLPAKLGAKIAPLVGAEPDELIVTDSTSVNLFKLLAGALRLRPGRTLILSERGNFPTDLYIAQGLIDQLGDSQLEAAAGAPEGSRSNRLRLELVERDELPAALAAAQAREQAGQGDLAVALLTQVDYRSGSRLDLRRITADVHAAGGLVLWDLAHSAGAFPLSLNEARADLAVGCGYKYLNGGPGAPAFAFVARSLQADFTQPLSGWMGHAAPFDFDPTYRPAQGIARLLCGTPPILSMIALEAGLDALLAAQPLGGLAALREKSLRLTRIFAQRALDRATRHGLRCITPMTDTERGSQVSFTLPDADMAHAVVQALIARDVIGDFRAPDILRFGFAPLYLRYVDAWDAAEQLADVLDEQAWKAPRFLRRATVT